ncbi:MAG: LytTR family transcriptional regulator DNA-binding domain-containing protein, partial [Bacteroidota bacterium]
IKIFQLWAKESEKNQNLETEVLEIRSSRRTHRVPTQEILFIEGLGNYVTYHLADKSKITSYGTIKATLELLPKNFTRVHKSYVINKFHIKSYDTMTIDVSNNSIPRGKSVTDDVLAL